MEKILYPGVTMSYLVLLACIIFSSSKLLACSNVAIVKNQYVSVARTMDFPVNSGETVAIGLKDKDNVSDLNLNQEVQEKAVTWKAKYNYLGQTWQKGSHVIDGINEMGLYAAYLYLPDFTRYPQYNVADTRAVLGMADLVNYILGMAESVQEAIVKIKEVQIIENAMPVKTADKTEFYRAPLHVIIRDRYGKACVLEWINGQTMLYADAKAVFTNAPTYDWQCKFAEQYNYVQTANINAKFNGAFMNGSGFLNIPGDWTPPGRFARATQVLKVMPAPKNTLMSLQLALSAIETVQVPLGTNESPTLWRSLCNLNDRIYYFQSLYSVDQDKQFTAISDPTAAWEKYDLKEILQNEEKQKGMVEALCTKTMPGEVKILINLPQTTPNPGK